MWFWCLPHLKVHCNGSIRSFVSDEGEWHIMAFSFWLIDYNLFSLESKMN